MKHINSIKHILYIALSLLSFNTLTAQLSGGGEANPDLKTNKESLKKFQDMRFGMFIHWGPVTLRGEEIGWSRKRSIPAKDYDNLYKEFNPVLYSAEDWVKTAKDAGMKYVVLTTRHHDGFSLWDSQFSDYDMANTPYGKGIVKSLADECRKQGLEFGVYYSVLDWWHNDYPLTRTENSHNGSQGPVRFVPENLDPEVWKKMDSYILYMKNQLRELIELTNPSIIWFDGAWEWPWTHKMGMDLYAYVRGLKDNLVINNRVDKAMAGVDIIDIPNRDRYAGDYLTPEQRVGGFENKSPWETCMTIGEQWAWKPNDKLKSTEECIRTLIQTVGGDGNLLFNVGPMPDGRIEQRQIDRLKEMGDWLKTNGEAVYGTRGGPYLPTKRMASTHKDNKIYLHLFSNEDKKLTLPLPKDIKVKKAYFLTGDAAVKVVQDKQFINISMPDSLPEKIASVLVLELNKPASAIEVFKTTNH